MYCYARIFRTYSHQEAVDGLQRLHQLRGLMEELTEEH